MEQEYTATATNQPAAFNQALSLPHFDEEATLLSARPVVPLNEVKAETRSKRRMILGLTIAAAVLGGAIGATQLLMQSGQDSSGEAETQLSQPVDPSSGASGGSEPNPVESKAQLPTATEDKPTTKEGQRSHPSTAYSRLERIPQSSAKPAKASTSVEESDENREADEWELRRAERREARRFNREARREGRYRREQTGDDLLRIREIFEGSPIP